MMSDSKHKPKYMLNDKSTIITQSLRGLCATNEKLKYYEEFDVIVDSYQVEEDKVRIICGGGSGHEPAHAGFVCEGMLTAAVCGDIFSSPTYVNVLAAVEKVYSSAGVLLVVKNYTGDIINFRLAMELARDKGLKVEMLIVDDDISLTNLNEVSVVGFNKRRGLCGTVLVYKILGGLSKLGKSLEEIVQYGKHVISSLYTIGVSLTQCIPPFTDSMDFTLTIPNNQCEVGLGIHGEKGKERINYQTLADIINYIFKNVLQVNIPYKEILGNNKLCLILNNLGSLTDIEMNTIIYSILEYIKTNYPSLQIKCLVYGKLMTSLDMKGFSLTLMSFNNNDFLSETENMNFILSIIKEKVDNKNWNTVDEKVLDNYKSSIIPLIESNKSPSLPGVSSKSKIRQLVRNLCEYLISKSEYLNELDREVGDGDLGSGVEKSLTAVLKNLDSLDFNKHLRTSLKMLGEIIASSFGGTSGPLYASLIIKGSEELNEEEVDNIRVNWAKFLRSGTDMIQKIGGAEVGDRTMVDILIPLCDFFENNLESPLEEIGEKLNQVVDDSLEKIRMLKSKRGRSAYLQGKEVGKHDPGCVLVSIWIRFIIDNLIKVNN